MSFRALRSTPSLKSLPTPSPIHHLHQRPDIPDRIRLPMQRPEPRPNRGVWSTMYGPSNPLSR